MKRILLCISAALLCAGAASAQRASYDTGGVAIDPHSVTAMDLFNLSQTQFNFGTARSAAMAGAFTSLGADMSSMSINPAGLGMYRHNEVAVTPMMSFSRSETSAAPFEKGNRNRFSLGNLGFVLKLRESAKGITAINIGFGYNRLADFNYRYSLASYGQSSSIADAYARQLRGSDISSGYLRSDQFYWGDVDPSLWGASLGYFTGLVSDASGTWERDMIAPNAEVGQFATVASKGSVGEYVISLGMNINNKVYVGASLGIHSISVRRNIYYGENYKYSGEPSLAYRMDYFNYDQSTKISGAGVNFKIGVVYRPIEGLRLGFAFHTPTYYSLTYKYRGGMTSDVKSIGSNPDGYELDSEGYLNPPLSESTALLVDDGSYSWEYISPSRMLFGASYTFGSFAVISVDYERDWYNGIRVKQSPYGKGLYDNFARDNFKGSNTLRIGAEVRVIPQIALRAGYGLWASALKDSSAIFSSPVIYRTDYVGAGIGFTLSKTVFLDLAYQYRHDKLTDYMTYYYYNDVENGSSPVYRTTLDRHSAILTLGFRF